MLRKILFGILAFALIFSLSAKKEDKAKLEKITEVDGWMCYTADSLPVDAGFTKNKQDSTEKVTIVKDKEIPGNQILKFEGPAEAASFVYNFPSQFNAITLVLRVKSVGTADRSWEVQVRNKGTREKVRQEKSKVNLERSKNSIGFADDGKWHIWRIVMVFGEGSVKTTVYMDESDTPSIENAESTDKASETDLSFGDLSSSQTYAAYYDWIVWRTDGAFKPSEKKLPDILTGLK